MRLSRATIPHLESHTDVVRLGGADKNVRACWECCQHSQCKAKEMSSQTSLGHERPCGRIQAGVTYSGWP